MTRRRIKWRKPNFKGLGNIRFPKLSTPRATFIKSFGIEKPANWLDAIVTIFLKTGTLFLILVLIIFVIRIFKSEGYVIEPFAVPEQLEKSGYDGVVVARKIQDEVFNIKQLAQTVKEDSIQLLGNEQPELDLRVMGVGISLRTLIYQMRNLLSQKNEIIQGEITAIGDQYELTLRMSGYPPVKHIEKIKEGNHKAAIDQLLTRAGEIIIGNIDPYRVAVLCYQQKRYVEAVDLVRKIIKERPQEIHWAYLAWGSILEEQNQDYAAATKFRRATELKPDFSLAHIRLSWNLSRQKEHEAAIRSMRKAVKYDSLNMHWWINLAWLLHAQENYEGADSAFQKATVLAPTEPATWSTWADSKISRGKPEEAVPLTQKAEEFAREDAMGYLSRALGSIARGDTINAFNHVMTALDFDPKNEIAIKAGINTSWAVKDYKKAIAIFENANLDNLNKYNRQQIYNLAAMCYNYKGRQDKAFQTVQSAIEIDPDMGYPYSTLAEIHALSGNLDKFYHFLEMAFEKGMEVKALDLNMEPYASLKEESKFKALINRYKQQLKG